MMNEDALAPIKVRIEHLAYQGDGVANVDGDNVFVPLTAPGDEVEIIAAQPKARLSSVITGSEQRQDAPCDYYGACGGCNLQHLVPGTYLSFKHKRLSEALEYAGFKNLDRLSSVQEIAPHSRRRIELKLQKIKKDLHLGFYRHASHDVVDITHCDVAAPEISALIEPLKAALLALKKPANIRSIQLSVYDEEIELVLKLKSPWHSADKTKLTQSLQDLNITRVCYMVESVAQTNPIIEMLFQQSAPIMQFGGVRVEMPAGAFIQATSKGQEILTNAALSLVENSDNRHQKRIADLYAGCGTYSFPLAEQGAKIHAYEGLEPMVHAISNAAKHAGLAGDVRASCRDLAKHPLGAKELANFDAVVINPPRAGAAAQSREIAEAGIKDVVMISCNPETLAKDLRHFAKADYELISATPVDQFVWTSHLESVVILRRVVEN